MTTPHDHAVATVLLWLAATSTKQELSQLWSELSPAMQDADGVRAEMYKREKELKCQRR